jgi:adenine/guanine phosphoribosyltransferase-like PRPP-binding protein
MRSGFRNMSSGSSGITSATMETARRRHEDADPHLDTGKAGPMLKQDENGVFHRRDEGGGAGMMERVFRDRREAGKLLARALVHYAGRKDVVVLGLPRGGVPVAAEVAQSLGAPLDVLIVRKLGAPGQEELAIGAIAEGGVRVLNRGLVENLGLTRNDIDQLAQSEEHELERRVRLYRDREKPLPVADRTVIVIDDGVATGATMRAGLQSVRGAGRCGGLGRCPARRRGRSRRARNAGLVPCRGTVV